MDTRSINHPTNLMADCIAHMHANGILFDGYLKTDGELHRFSRDSKKNQPDEWYRCHQGVSSKGNPYLNCHYGTWSGGQETFTYNSYEASQGISQEEQAEILDKEEQRKKHLDQELREEKKRRIEKAQETWDQAIQDPTTRGHTSYLERKQVNAYGIKYRVDYQGIPAVVIPLCNLDDQLQAVQCIQEDGTKRIYGVKKGNFHVIGVIEAQSTIFIAEGYATAASIHQATNSPAIVAFDCGNLKSVVHNLREKYPQAKFIIAADDDRETPGNPGKTKAEETAKAYGCDVIIPVFPNDFISPSNKRPKDFNDLYVHFGLDEVRRQVDTQLSIPCATSVNPKLTQQEPVEQQRCDEGEIEDDVGDENLRQVKASARRWALLYQRSKEEIVRGICKQYPKIKDQADSIASNAIEWSRRYQTGNKVTVNGIPKSITDMKSLDLRFAQLEAPGQPCVIIHRSDAQPISPNDFNKRLSGEVVLVGVDNKGQPKYLAASTFWTGNTHKQIYKDIVFTNKRVGNDIYNLFTGFGVQPKEGNCDRILTHIKEIICAGNETNGKALIQLLAWQMQNIGKPSRIVVALKSRAQQVGKGCLLSDILAVIYGNSGFMTGDLGQIITRFNDTLRGKAFIFLDEALFSGDRKAADTIKSLATATRLAIETKNLPIVQMPCGVNLFLATNHDDAAYVEEADVRYWILEASPNRVGDTEYFRDLYAEIEGGGREAFMHHLLHLDVSSFIPSRDVPLDNAFKEAMIRNSINPFDARKWLEECCRAEMILGYKPIVESASPWESWQKGQEYPNGIFNTAYTEWQKTVKSPVAAKPTPANKFGELLNKAGLEQRVDGERLRTLPDPKECLQTVIGMIEKGGKK
jgi:putative DNA primase/helicase